MVGIATYIPNYELRIPLVNLYIKLWQLVAFFIVMNLISLSGGNGGGHFAHLGGALFGFLYVNKARRPTQIRGYKAGLNIEVLQQKPLKPIKREAKRK